MSRPADASQRSAALELADSFIVQAPAGSGKTELLTQRFLKLLAQVDRPERILAITFTRKATREMHERIVSRLRQAHRLEQGLLPDVSAPENEHERLAIELARAVLQRDRTHGWQLLKNPGRLRVYTIDGLCVQLLARDPERGSHVAGRKVLEDAKPLYRRAVQNLFEQLGLANVTNGQSMAVRDALVRLLVHLDGDAAALQGLLVSMLAVRDQWMRKMGIDHASLQTVLQDRQEEELARFRAALGAGPGGSNELTAAMRLVAALGQSVDDPGSDAAEFSRASAQQCSNSADELRLAHLFSKVFLTAGRSARKPGGISRALFKGVAADTAHLIPELKEIYAQWHENSETISALERMALHPPLDLGNANTALRDDIREVLKHTLAHLRLLFAGQGTADFQFMAENALECLGDADNPGQVLLDEDLRLEHILMDEFQDTSNTQFELLSRLMSGWEAGGGRSLFLVGDPMQSIYRFREANVGLFIDVVQRGRVADIPLRYLRLESNFRSNSEIVDWVNHQFSHIFPRHDERDSGAVSYAYTQAEVGPGGQVQVHPLPPDSTDQDEARLAAELIRQAQAGLPQPRIAVLARARSHLAPLARVLAEQGIGFEAVKVDPLASRPVVNDLLAITRALIHPADRVAWLALLRAPWCGLNTREMHQLAGDDARADLLQRMGVALDFSAEEITRKPQLRRLQQVLGNALALRGSQPLHDCVEYTWLHLGGPYCYASAVELENASAFLSLLAGLEREGSEDLLGRLDEKLGELYASSSPSTLQLMTIHQAKGLEFDVVIVPGLHRQPKGGDQPLVALQEFRTRQSRDTALMAALPARGDDAPSVYGYLRAVDAERSAYEAQRVLYVAATRAKNRLHLLGRYRQDKKTGTVSATSGTFLHLLLAAFEPHIAAPVETSEEEKPIPARPVALPLLRLVNPPALPEPRLLDTALEPARLRELPSREATALGAALHQWLELIHDHWQQGWSAAWFEQHQPALASTLRRVGASEERIPDLLVELTAMLVRTLSSAASQDLVSPAGRAASWAELQLYRREATGFSQHIIDRLYQQADGSLVVLDYKSGDDTAEAREHWREQLGRYRQLLEQLDAGRVARTLIYQAKSGTVIDLSKETDAG